MIKPVALEVMDDEPAFRLSEMNLQSPGSRGWRRYQVIDVVRNDQLAEYREDLGPAWLYAAHQFNWIGGVVDEDTGKIQIFETVGRLREYARRQREEEPFTAQIEPTDLIGEYANYIDELPKIDVVRSTFGPGGVLVRSG